jgi:hypothetical protein
VSALMWWLIPIGATLLALLWAAWRSRPARQVDMHTSIHEQARFKAAMKRPMPRPGGPRQRDPNAATRPSASSARRARRDSSAAGRGGPSA